MKNVRLISISLLLIASLACCGEWDGYESFVASNYNFQVWRSETKTNYSHVISEWELPTLNLATNGISCVNSRLSNSGQLTELFLFAGTNEDVILRVCGVVCTNVISAHESMIDYFSKMSTPILHERMTNGVGDVCFTYPLHAGAYSTVAFARNNVMVSILSQVDGVPATNIATQIDMDILEKSIRDSME